MELKGAVAVVTGAARGLGRAIAEAYAAEGALVALVDVLEEQLQETAAEIGRAGRTVLPVAADVTEAAQVASMVERVERELGPIGVLVNNAGTFSVIGPVWEVDHEKWFRDVRVNLYGSFLCCRAVVGRMVERKTGYVINIVSSGGVGDPHPYSTSYASSKTALMRLTEGLAAEAREHGVKVFALAPPAVLTAMTEFILNDPAGRKWRPQFKETFRRGRDHPPELVAKLAVELLGGRADALTGRYFEATCDLEETLRRSAEIVENDLLTLRLRK